MAAPKQARPGAAAAKPARGGAAAAGRPAGAKRDRGTRGGRPDAPAAVQPRPGKKPPAGPGRPARATVAEAAAGPVPIRVPPLWLQLTTWVLAFGGLGVSIYLTVAHYTSSSILACSDKGLVNCGEVTTSSESMVFGVIPVAVLGLAFYAFLVAVMSPWAWRAKFPVLTWVRLASLVIGIVFVLYLVYAELFSIGAICLWCTSVHGITFVLFVLVVVSAAVGYGLRDPELSRGGQRDS
jgi:uncharacterized membrane protein